MPHTKPETDARLDATNWVAGEVFDVYEAVDTFVMDPGFVLRMAGDARWGRPDGKGRTMPHRGDYELRSGELWVQVIADNTDIRTRPTRNWRPADQPGLADELVALEKADSATIIDWVKANGFVGVRADPRERAECVEEIRLAVRYLGQARAILRAIRDLRGPELRAEVERQMNYEPGFLTAVQSDPDHQPLSGRNLARFYGVQVPSEANWRGAGAYIQALHCLGTVLDGPMKRLLKVSAHVAPTEDGLRLQGSILAIGPLATAYQQTLNEASWPAITSIGSLLQISWRAMRRCTQCGQMFRPARRDQHWCGRRCRWAHSADSRRAARRTK
jgi:hypothetical protein